MNAAIHPINGAWASFGAALYVFVLSLVAGVVALGLNMDRVVLQGTAGVLLVVVSALRLWGNAAHRAHMPAGHAALALWSFVMATAHGAGMMIVPALIPLCLGDSPAREITASGSLTHTAFTSRRAERSWRAAPFKRSRKKRRDWVWKW